MRNGLTDLNNLLFEASERIMSCENIEELQLEATRAQALTGVSKQIIDVGSLALQAEKHAQEYYGKSTENATLIGVKNGVE